MFEKRSYVVNRIAGDYAYLVIESKGNTTEGTPSEEKCVARALLPEEIVEGSRLNYEMMQYEIVKD